MKKLQNQLLFRYNVRYIESTRNVQKKLEKNFLIKLKNDELKSLIETKKKRINQLNCKKISALLISNFISAIKHNKQIIISLDDHVLTDKNISCKFYKAIINRLQQADLVEIHKGFYNNSMLDYQHPYRISKRTRLVVTDKLKNYIVGFFLRNNIDLLSIINIEAKKQSPELRQSKHIQNTMPELKSSQNGLKTQIKPIINAQPIMVLASLENLNEDQKNKTVELNFTSEEGKTMNIHLNLDNPFENCLYKKLDKNKIGYHLLIFKNDKLTNIQ